MKQEEDYCNTNVKRNAFEVVVYWEVFLSDNVG